MGYRVVDGPCTDLEAVQYYASATVAAGTAAYTDASNEWSWLTGGGPPCTRTAVQMLTLESDPETGPSTITGTPATVDADGSDGLVTIQDRVCRHNYKATHGSSTAHDGDFCRALDCTDPDVCVRRGAVGVPAR